MTCSSWVDYAEQKLFELAAELRRVPLDETTRRWHLRALELKREVMRWRERPPEPGAVDALLDEVERLAARARSHPTLAERSRSAALATARSLGSQT